MTDIITDIQALGASDATQAKTACGQIAPCDQIDDSAIDAIRAILRSAGDDRADMSSLGYIPAGRDLMAAYAAGWDEVADA